MKLVTDPDFEVKNLDLPQFRELVNTFLEELGLPFVSDGFDKTFYDACREDMIARGWPAEIISALQPNYLRLGVTMGCTAFSHLSNMSTRLFIARYTALLNYLDDQCYEHIEELRSFNRIYCQRGSHKLALLNAVSQLLDEISQHFSEEASSIILTSSLNYINGILIENVATKLVMPKHPNSTKFPKYVRALSGIPEAFAMFIFPPEIPFTSYLQALPDLFVLLNQGNDIFSFYKEELSGEQDTLIALLAASRNVSRLQAAQEVKDETVASSKMIIELLGPDTAAINTYKVFLAGYAAFHTSLSRYKLLELLNGPDV